MAAGTTPNSVAIGDVSGDGNPDLAVANESTNMVSVLLGNGAGGFGAKTDFAAGDFPYSVAIADVSGDGRLDLAVTYYNSSNNTVAVLLGNGAGGFGASTDFAPGPYSYSPAVGDVSGDGKPDLVVAHFSSNTVSVLLGFVPTRASLAVSPNPAVLGSAVTLTATVSIPAPGYGAPSDSVRFFDGTTLLGTSPVNGGVANLTIVAERLGDRSLTAVYKGDGRLFGSISIMQIQRVVSTAMLGFIRGDADGSGELNISDPAYSLAYQFAGGPPPACLDVADDDDSGEVNISDPIYSLSYEFAGGPPPPAPFPGCGPDPTPDLIGCDQFPSCGGKARPEPQVTKVVDGSKRLLLETVPGTSPDTLSLQVTVATDVPLAGLEGMAGYDPSRLRFVRFVKSGSGPRMDFLSARDLADPPRVRLGGVPDFGLAEVLEPGTYEIGRLVFARRGPTAPLHEAAWLMEGRFVGQDRRAYRIEGEAPVDPTIPGVSEGESAAGSVITTLHVAPNPFTGSTMVHLAGPPATSARVLIFDAAGRLVRTVWDGVLDGREMTITWDGRDQSGREVPAGIYLLRGESTGGQTMARLVKCARGAP